MPYVRSSALARVRYNEATHTLCATFRESGRTYAYQDVPRDIEVGHGRKLAQMIMRDGIKNDLPPN